jgi:hypothetical protein
MKWLVIPAAAAFSLAVATPALATADTGPGRSITRPASVQTTAGYIQLADRHDRHHGQQGGQKKKKKKKSGQQGGQRGGRGMTRGGSHRGNHNMTRGGAHRGNNNMMRGGSHRGNHNMMRGGSRRGGHSATRSGRFNWHNYRRGHRPPNWARHRRNFNRRAWQRNFRAHRRFHWRPYRRPTGWYSRHWEYGMTLPFLFWTENYWINGYGQFGLEDPPYGYVWTRVGDDALLVDVETGYILRVVYGVFY